LLDLYANLRPDLDPDLAPDVDADADADADADTDPVPVSEAERLRLGEGFAVRIVSREGRFPVLVELGLVFCVIFRCVVSGSGGAFCVFAAS